MLYIPQGGGVSEHRLSTMPWALMRAQQWPGWPGRWTDPTEKGAAGGFPLKWAAFHPRRTTTWAVTESRKERRGQSRAVPCNLAADLWGFHVCVTATQWKCNLFCRQGYIQSRPPSLQGDSDHRPVMMSQRGRGETAVGDRSAREVKLRCTGKPLEGTEAPPNHTHFQRFEAFHSTETQLCFRW